MDTYDIAIVGAGIAGGFAALKIAKEYKNTKTILFELGKAPHKRRYQICGWLGILPNSDGKLFINDINEIENITTSRKANTAYNYFNNYVSNIIDFKITNDRAPNVSMEKKIQKSEFEIRLNDFIQLYPKDIHILSKNMSNILFSSKNITMSFDNEVLNITKEGKSFILESDGKKIECKKLIICTGRSGWRWTKQLYDSFGIIENNDIAKFGIRVEATTSVMKDFNKSNCSIFKDKLDIGPLSWNGTVIPEDHMDLAISAFRSNENRWKSDKVSFNLIGHRFFKDNGFEQTNRIGQLTFILSNERILKEKISTILNGKSKISVIPEYDWLPAAINDICGFMPDIATKGYFHVPTILPVVPKIKLKNDFSTEIDGMYCAGEASGIVGILAAATTGLIAADSACK